MVEKRDSESLSTPIPVRLRKDTLELVDTVSKEMNMNKQEVMRLAIATGLKSLERIGYEGMIKAICEQAEREDSE